MRTFQQKLTALKHFLTIATKHSILCVCGGLGFTFDYFIIIEKKPNSNENF